MPQLVLFNQIKYIKNLIFFLKKPHETRGDLCKTTTGPNDQRPCLNVLLWFIPQFKTQKSQNNHFASSGTGVLKTYIESMSNLCILFGVHQSMYSASEKTKITSHWKVTHGLGSHIGEFHRDRVKGQSKY